MTAAAPPIAVPASRRLQRLIPWLILIAGVLGLQIAFGAADSFPAGLDTTFAEPIDRAGAWMRANRRTHWLFTGVFAPITGVIDGAINALEALFLWFPWYVLIGLVFLVAARNRRFGQAAIAATALVYTGLIGLWRESIETLALMSAAVLISAIIGIPLGVWAALRPRVEQVIRPVLDAMQTIPAFLYFLPLLMLFGVGNVPGAVATIIYALPPVVRLTTLGIRRVPTSTVEASQMFGATTRQTLFKVQLPTALPTILTGLSQTIMMALGIVVLATLVGAAGLGSPILQSLNQRRTGRGIAAGLAIVAVAMVLDRIWRALASGPGIRRSRRSVISIGALLVAGLVIGRAAGWSEFPTVWSPSLFDPIDQVVVWARDTLSFMTRPFNDFIVASVYIPVRDFLTHTLAWPVLVFAGAWACWMVKGWRLALFTALGLLAIGLVGMWDSSIDTSVQVAIATAIAVSVAIPMGVWAGRRPRVEAAIGPFLDGLQTVPSLVYIIPAVTLFGVGVVPGIIATVLYAIVPGVRITALGIRSVPEETIEASTTFGATPRQTMFGVRLPLAAPTIMAGINQVIMMVLAMVIITGLVGAGALGFKVTEVLARSLFGEGFEVALALTLIAMMLDRFSEAATARLEPPSGR